VRKRLIKGEKITRDELIRQGYHKLGNNLFGEIWQKDDTWFTWNPLNEEVRNIWNGGY